MAIRFTLLNIGDGTQGPTLKITKKYDVHEEGRYLGNSGATNRWIEPDFRRDQLVIDYPDGSRELYLGSSQKVKKWLPIQISQWLWTFFVLLLLWRKFNEHRDIGGYDYPLYIQYPRTAHAASPIRCS